MALKSWSSRHFPDFFLITKIGVFQGEVEGSKCPNLNCSSTSPVAWVVLPQWRLGKTQALFMGVGDRFNGRETTLF